MKNYSPTTTNQPAIVKYVQQSRNGIQVHSLSRHGIGYVLRGKKYIYYGDVRYEIKQGDLFYLNIGHHYIENVPEGDKPFEQIIFYYSPENLGRVIMKLTSQYNMQITNDHICDNCIDQNHVIYPAWGTAKNFFNTVNHYLKEDLFNSDLTAESLKSAELIYLLISRENCCIKGKIMNNIDLSIENFENVIHNHIFDNISIDDLACLCNRSLTSFKKEFKKHFFEPPHKWLIKQRLMYSRLLLISTSKSISEIGNECSFPNTSHFIKLFKNQFGHTPASYRSLSRKSLPDDVQTSTRMIPTNRLGAV